jgi:hypothetical protein
VEDWVSEIYTFSIKASLQNNVGDYGGKEDSITAKIMKGKYYPNGSVLDAKLGNKPSFIWRSILSSRSLIQDGLVWRIGDGSRVHIWGDKWLPPLLHFVLIPLLKALLRMRM